MNDSAVASIRRTPLPWYFAIAFAWAWTDWIGLALTHQRVGVGPVPSHFPGLFGPMIAAFVVTAAAQGRPGVADLARRMFQWRVPPRWYLAALSPLAFGAIAWIALSLTPQGPPKFEDLGRMGGAPTLHPVALFFALIVLNGYSEEVGWRGFLLPRLQSRWSPLVASLVLALPWAVWHLPSFYVLESYRGMTGPMLVGFFIGLACGSIILAWIYNGARGSILLAALYHAGLNLTSATFAARGAMAAIVTTLVMIHAIVLVALELGARRVRRPGPLSLGAPSVLPQRAAVDSPSR